MPTASGSRERPEDFHTSVTWRVLGALTQPRSPRTRSDLHLAPTDPLLPSACAIGAATGGIMLRVSVCTTQIGSPNSIGNRPPVSVLEFARDVFSAISKEM